MVGFFFSFFLDPQFFYFLDEKVFSQFFPTFSSKYLFIKIFLFSLQNIFFFEKNS